MKPKRDFAYRLLLFSLCLTTSFMSFAQNGCPSGPLPRQGGPLDKWHAAFVTGDSIVQVPTDTLKSRCFSNTGNIAIKNGVPYFYANGRYQNFSSASTAGLIPYTDTPEVIPTKYGIDTMRIRVNTAISSKVNVSDSLSGYLTHFQNDTAKSNIRAQIPTNNNQLTNGAGYVTPSSSATFTNKSGAISQWTNDAGYITGYTETDPLSFHKTDSNTFKNPVTLSYANTNYYAASNPNGYISSFTESDPLSFHVTDSNTYKNPVMRSYVQNNFYPLVGNPSNFLTGNQSITLTGPITGSGTTSIATTIGSGQVTNTMLAGSIAASKLIGTDITTLGTISTGTWNGSSISTTYTDAKLKTLTGTTNRTTIGGTSTDPTVDISASYAGQSTITTLGTITTGTWNGTQIGTAYLPTTVLTTTNTATVTNKNIASRTNVATNYVTSVTMDWDSYDAYVDSSQAGALLFNAPTYTGNQWDDARRIYIRDDGTARGLTWNAAFISGSDVTLPSTTTLGKWMVLEFAWIGTRGKWMITGKADGYAP